MVKKSGIGQRLYVHGFDISGDVGQIDGIGSPIALLDVTSIDKSGVERIMGRRDARIAFSAFFNKAADREHLALKGLPTTDVLAVVLFGTTLGDEMAAISAKQINYDATRGGDGAFGFGVELLGSAGFPLEYGLVLVAKTTSHTSNGSDETGINFGSQTTIGAVGFLQHFEDTSPSGTIEYDIEDSSDSTNGDDGSWANLLAFSDVATPWAGIAERIVAAGTVEKWTRASTNGTFTNASFSMSLRRRQTGDYDAA